MHILENVFVWSQFRRMLDLFGNLYQRRFALIREFGISPCASVLDVGCGTGQYSQITDGDYLGIDMDPGYIQSASRKYRAPKRQFKCRALQQIDLAEKKFDAALLIDLSHHLPKADFHNLLASLTRIVSGHIILTDPLRQNRINLWGRMLTALDRGNFIRSKEEELSIVRDHCDVVQAETMHFWGVQNIMIFAKTR
ncbi:MAG: class I SAM-dependent methyltransferase [Deltaproteobacteria bacterium]|nr:class I SAM-dependent methyltransferase [Deltaproteobacteria bacterium]MBI4223342.1 class I SAM-dependent methyltransferase [Deltaproteobacteria bacterium]